jgi:hypothetical protein
LCEADTDAKLLNIKIRQSPVNTDQSFDEVCLVRRFLPSMLGTGRNEIISCEKKWVRIFENFDEQSILLPYIVEVTDFCLLHT